MEEITFFDKRMQVLCGGIVCYISFVSTKQVLSIHAYRPLCLGGESDLPVPAGRPGGRDPEAEAGAAGAAGHEQ